MVNRTENKKAAVQLELFEEWLQIRDPSTSHYPSIFGLTSMFLPVKDRAKGNAGAWKPEIYYTDEFTIKRHGEGLSTYDEDTLIAIMQLSSERRIIGAEDEVRKSFLLPETVKEIEPFTPEFRNNYLVGSITAYKINKYFGRGTSGPELKDTVVSMLRLSSTGLTISKKGSSRIVNTHFFSLIYDENKEAPITVVIDPIMAGLMQDFVIMDLSLRRKLTPIGKGVYRYLEASGKLTIPVLELMEKIGTTLSVAEFNRALLGRKPTKNKSGTHGELKVLKDAGWCTEYDISGTGRSKPFILNIVRSQDR